MKNKNFKALFEYQILKTFIKNIKKEHLYYTFRTSFINNKKDIYNVFKHKINDKSQITPFSVCLNYEDVLKVMMESCGKININEKEEVLQHAIMNHVNTLIHYCIEPYITDYKILEKIGKNIFNESCEKLFGDSFEDKIKVPEFNEINASFKNYNVVPPQLKDGIYSEEDFVKFYEMAKNYFLNNQEQTLYHPTPTYYNTL